MQQKAIFQICVNHTRCRRLCGFGVGENEIIVCFDIKFLYTDKHDDSNSTLNCGSKLNVTLIPYPLIKTLTPMFAKHLVVWLLLEKKNFLFE